MDAYLSLFVSDAIVQYDKQTVTLRIPTYYNSFWDIKTH